MDVRCHLRGLLPGLLCLVLGACVPASPRGSSAGPVTPTAAPVASPSPPPASPAPLVEGEGPPLPLLNFRPQGDPRAGLEGSASLPGYDQVRHLRDNPVPWGAASVREGQELYRQHCSSCHCWDGDGDGPASAGLRPAPRNFKNLKEYRFGTGDLALFRTARHGIPGTAMPAAPATLTDDQLWKIVHFLRMLQPDPHAAEVLIDAAPSMSTAVKSGLYDGEMNDHDTYAWTDGPTTRFAFSLAPRPGPYRLTVRATSSPALARVDMNVVLNGRKLGSVRWLKAQFFDFRTLTVPPGALRPGENKLTFQYRQVAPLSAADPRRSSLMLDYVTLVPAAAAR